MSNDKVAATFHSAPDLTPEQDLRAHVTDLLTDATHFNGCPGGTDTCRCLIGRLNWAINAEEITATEGNPS